MARVALAAVVLAACHGCRAPQLMPDRVDSIQVLGFAGCPNTPELLYRVKLATIQSSIDVTVVYLDQNALDDSDVRRGYPAPTVLVNGHDLFGMPVPDGTASACRVYAGGLPATKAIAQKLQVVNQGT